MKGFKKHDFSRSFDCERRRAFTIKELLAVIGIFSVLMAILLPLINGVRMRADEIKCSTNLRSVGQAIMLYTQDHDNTLPYVISSSFIPGSSERHWRRAILPYVGLRPTAQDVRNTPFICPPLYRMIEAAGGEPGIPNYGMNLYIENLSLAVIEDPANTLLATEAKLIHGVTPSERHYEGNMTSAVPGGKVHRGGQNVLFVDGHIRWIENASKLGELPYASGGEKDVWSPRKN